jgi:hypothetical protein
VADALAGEGALMIPLTPLALVATANAFVGMGEDGGDELDAALGKLVRRFLREVRNRRRRRDREARRRGTGRRRTHGGIAWPPWDAAFVHYTGYWSHYDPRVKKSSWPLPATGSVEELAQFAGVSGASRESPLGGDVFLLWSPAERLFVRTGIVTHVERRAYFSRGEKFYECVTIEGDSDASAEGPGTRTLRRVRRFAPQMGDRFIRWTALDGREERREEIERELDFQATNAAA